MTNPYRTQVVEARGKPCAYCGEPMLQPTRDHILPRAKGGRYLGDGNLALVCRDCNRSKGERTIAQYCALLAYCGDPRAVHVANVIAHLRRTLPPGRAEWFITGDPLAALTASRRDRCTPPRRALLAHPPHPDPCCVRDHHAPRGT